MRTEANSFNLPPDMGRYPAFRHTTRQVSRKPLPQRSRILLTPETGRSASASGDKITERTRPTPSGSPATYRGEGDLAMASPKEARFAVLQRLKQATKAKGLGEECQHLNEARRIVWERHPRTATPTNELKTEIDDEQLYRYIRKEIDRNLHHQKMDYCLHLLKKKPLLKSMDERKEYLECKKATQNGELSRYTNDKFFVNSQKEVRRKLNSEFSQLGRAVLSEKRNGSGRRLESIRSAQEAEKSLPKNQDRMCRALNWLLHYRI